MASPVVTCIALNSDEGPHLAIFQENGFEVAPCDRSVDFFNEDNLINALKGCHAVIAGSEPYTERVLSSLPDLRIITRSGVGFDAVNLAAADANGVVVTTTPGVNHHAVAEHTIAMLMAVGRGFPDQDQRVREGRWQRIAYPRIMGTTLGLIGLGRIGQAVATRAVGLGMQVLVTEPYPDMDFVENWNIELVDLDQLLTESDYVSIHSPLLAETRGMMNAAAFRKMKKSSVFINTARGGLVNEPDLIAALESGEIRAAALDVFEKEPLPVESPLTKMSNVLLAGHVAGLDIESHRDTLTMAAETIVALRNGEWPAHCIQNFKDSKWSWE
ncbi:MAG: phosphoglycerate dehydrogenase [Planctomycetaceae bacterium]|nr:phosphoglycerate dehydrogenase [Planctomycetaceae bacterium]MCB9952724.1 phosphoglycerate dehydrogenase [Planctomycetaceae bacterium]